MNAVYRIAESNSTGNLRRRNCSGNVPSPQIRIAIADRCYSITERLMRPCRLVDQIDEVAVVS
jgi:hypothetical protein